MSDFTKACEDAAKNSKFRDDLKMSFCCSSHQPDITWSPVESGKKFECFQCGITATVCCNKKVFACDKCMWTYKNEK